MTSHVLLVLGGVRSGKSRYAQERASAVGERVLVIASGVVTDDEMAARIERHRARRPACWRTVEVQFGLAAAVRQAWQGEGCVLVDDLGTAVTNRLVEQQADEERIVAEARELGKLAGELTTAVIVVSPEVGLGVVPPSPLGRQFIDLVGLANEALAAAADEVVLMVAGLPLRVKG